MSRAQRLYRPVFYYVVFWLVIAWPLLALTVGPGITASVMSLSVQLLWFLGVYLLVLACLPLLARVRRSRDLWLTVGGLYGVTALVDALRLSGSPAVLGLSNFLWVWLIPAAIGVGYTRKLISRQVAIGGVLVAAVIDVALVTIGPYELSLVTIPGQRLSNMTPPSLLLAGHAVILSLLAVLLGPVLNRWARRPWVWWFVAIGNSGAMTLYLWHLPALMLVVAASHQLGYDRSNPSQPGFVALLLIQMLVFYLLTAVLFLLLLRLENTPIAFWDSPVDKAASARTNAAGIVLVLAGVGTLLLARYGLSSTGLVVLAATFGLLLTARLLTVPNERKSRH